MSNKKQPPAKTATRKPAPAPARKPAPAPARKPAPAPARKPAPAPARKPAPAPAPARKPAPAPARKPAPAPARKPAPAPKGKGKQPTPATRQGTPYAGERNATGRDCARVHSWNGYDVPRIRPPRGVATPKGYELSRWQEKEGRGCPIFAVRDCYNVGQVRSKETLPHAAMRSLCVAGVKCNEETGVDSFDPAARHSFVIDEDNCTFIVW